MPRGEMYVHVLPEHFGDAAEAFGTALALELAVLTAVGLPGAVCAVTEAWTVVRDGRQTWHAETPPEVTDMLCDDRDPVEALGVFRDAAELGLCDFRLSWHEGLPPEDGGLEAGRA